MEQWTNVRDIATLFRRKWTSYLIVAPLLGGLIGMAEQPEYFDK